jgi:heat shock protein 5
VPQIEVSFEVDANGILQVSAEDKGTGKAERITITSEKGRLSDEEIQRMVNEHEQNLDADKKLKIRIDARNGLESYVYNMKNTLLDEATDKIPSNDLRDITDMLDETLDWMDYNAEEDAEAYLEKQREIEQVTNPIMRQLYHKNGDNWNEDNSFDFGDDDL